MDFFVPRQDTLVSKVVLRCGHVIHSYDFEKSVKIGKCTRQHCQVPLEPSAKYCINLYAEKWKIK